MKQTIYLSLAKIPRVYKRIIALVHDVSLSVISVWFAYYLRLDEFFRFEDISRWPVIVAVLLSTTIFVSFGLYRAIFRYSGWTALMTIIQACAIYGLIYMTIFTAIGVDGVPRTIGILQPILMMLGVGASRAAIRFAFSRLVTRSKDVAASVRVLIYGAGDAGRQIAVGLKAANEMDVVGFIDDDPQLQNHVINGLKVYAPQDLGEVIPGRKISSILLALPSAGRRRRHEIVRGLMKHKVNVRALPGMVDLANGRVSINDIQDLDIHDLLGRDLVQPDESLLKKNITGKVVMVTGAGGSIGSELCRQILALAPIRLILVEFSEFALYTIDAELREKLGPDDQSVVVPVMASVCDMAKMDRLMSEHHPDTVYHAAAYKHVPLVEANPCEGIRNNVLGTLTVAMASQKHQVSRFVMISTDKAVRPPNVMGASKRLAEMLIQSMAAKSSTTCFSMVRFGNVLGSSGSVIPRFRQQILNGGPITLTHKDIIRYFMTIPEAVQLVIQAGAMSEGGDVFVLDMGEPVRIYDLALRMIELSGLSVCDEMNPDGDIEIVITGLRPGEKLFEELLIGDGAESSDHPSVWRAREWFQVDLEHQATFLSLLDAVESGDSSFSVNTLRSIILPPSSDHISANLAA